MFDEGDLTGGEGSVLLDRNAPLDHDVLATIVSILLNLKDGKCSADLPLFRIRELMTIVQRTRTTLLNEGRLAECVLAFFALCLHYSVHTSYDSEILVELISLLQYLAIESLIVEQKNRRPNTLELLNPVDVFKKDEQVDTHYKLEIFAQNFEIAKQITRETLMVSRSLQKLKTMKPEERKRSMPKHVESIQPYCIHFMANLALCHIVSILHQVGNLILCPGMIEYLVLEMLTNVTVPGSSGSKRGNGGCQYDYAYCLNSSNQLARFVGHYVLNEQALKQLHLLKVRVSKKLTHPEISFIQYRVSTFRSLLVMNGNAKSVDSVGLTTQKILIEKGCHIFSECELAIDVQNSPHHEEDEETSVTFSNNKNHLLHKEAQKSVSVQRSSEEIKRVNHYWELKRTFRPLFLTLSSFLRKEKSHSGFCIDYNPELKEFPAGDFSVWEGIRNMNATAALKYLEGYYFYWNSKDYIPRTLDPMEEVYWIGQYSIEYLVKKAEAGEGFCPSPSQEKQFLLRKLKSFRSKTKINASGESRTSYKDVKLPVISPVKSSDSRSVASINPSKMGRSSGKSLAEILAKAKEEAQLEARIHRVDAKLRGFQTADVSEDDDDESTNSAEQLEIVAMLNDARPKSRGGDFGRSCSVRSCVWFCEPKAGILKKPSTIFAGVEGNLDNPLENLPTKAESQEYARQLEELKRKKVQEDVQFRQYLEDQQESIISKNRAMKAATLRNMREKMKEELQAKTAMKSQWEEERRKQHIQDLLKGKQLEKDREELELREKYRIKQIKEMKSYQNQREAEDYAMKLEREKLIISRIANQKEADEIRRMLAEEDRMRYLEERRRAIEKRIDEQRINALMNEQKRKDLALENVDKMQARVRMGNFVWHNGTFGFYDGVRKKPVNYVQYEDEQGVPYYYDPLNNTYQNRRPTDAPIKHYTDDERREYDAVHGEGAYDAYKADIAFKDYVNKNGGYFDENNEWISVHGYYDESGNWVEHDGYYNEKGRYIKYAKVQGTLDFMV